MRAEYDLDYSKAVRGRYYRRLLKGGANVVILDPDVAKGFPQLRRCERGAAFPPPDVRGYAASLTSRFGGRATSTHRPIEGK